MINKWFYVEDELDFYKSKETTREILVDDKSNWTGLLDQNGTPIYKPKFKIGFIG